MSSNQPPPFRTGIHPFRASKSRWARSASASVIRADELGTVAGPAPTGTGMLDPNVVAGAVGRRGWWFRANSHVMLSLECGWFGGPAEGLPPSAGPIQAGMLLG